MSSAPIHRSPALLLAAGLLLAVLPACDGSDGEAQQAPAQADPDGPSFDLGPMGFNEGDERGAVVRVIEFSDFGCIHCARFHMESYPELHDEFVEAGDVIWKYIPITIGGFPNGREAALAGECAGAQERFPAMRDLLFEEREAWMAADDAEELFEGYARQAGLDVEAFGACLESDAPRERVDEANRLARDIGVTGTPTFIVQGYPVQGAPPLDAFQDVLRQMVAEARDPAGS